MDELLQILKGVELFRDLSEQQLDQISKISKKEVYSKGDTICKQGNPGDAMYVIATGQVEINVRDNNGNSYPALYLGAGQLVGEMALVDEGTRSASVIGIEDQTIVHSIPNNKFTALCVADTAIGYIMMRNIAQDLSFKLRHRDFDPSDT
jgi:CRP/FNR family transcriptional regulator, cyclic AMP receptor protein